MRGEQKYVSRDENPRRATWHRMSVNKTPVTPIYLLILVQLLSEMVSHQSREES